jgi:hypothetical protein
MEILVAVISLLVFGVFLAVAVALSKVPVLGNALDFFAELVSGPRFVYLAWPFLLSTAYRKEIILEHKNRIKWLAWVEYFFGNNCVPYNLRHRAFNHTPQCKEALAARCSF